MIREMKDSGIEWIGEIPADWEYEKLKTLYIFEKGKNAQVYTVDYIGQHKGKYPVYSGQTENNGVMGTINSFDYDLEECLFSTTDGAKVMTPRILKGKFNLSQNCLIMKQIKKCDNHFIFYFLNPLFAYEKSLIPSYMQPSLRIEDLKKYSIYLPSIAEQQKLSAYLDTKCNKIDSIIEKQEKVIEKLKEYKLSKINEIVTDVDGICCHLGHISLMKNGLNFNLSPDGNKVKFLGVGDFKDYFVLNDKSMFSDIIIDDEIHDDYLLQNDDIIFVRSNGSKDLVGRAVMVENIDYKLTYSGFCIKFRNTRDDLINDKYLLYFFRSPYFRKQLEKYSQGSNISNINQVLLSQISIIIPSLSYQNTALKNLTNYVYV